MCPRVARPSCDVAGRDLVIPCSRCASFKTKWRCWIGSESRTSWSKVQSFKRLNDRRRQFCSQSINDLLSEVFINQNTSLAPDACVFGPSPLNVIFDSGNIYPSVQECISTLGRTFNVSYVHCPTRRPVGATRYPIV